MCNQQLVRMGVLALVLAGPASGAEVSRYLPDDTEIVVFVNVRQLLDAPLVKKHALEQLKAAINGNVDGQKLLNAVGLDPLKDIDSITVGGPGRDLKNRAVILITGKFDLDRIHAVAEEVAKADADALKIHKQGNLRIFESKGKDGGNSGFAYFPNGSTLLASPSLEPLLSAIRGTEQKTPRLHKSLAALIQGVDARHSAWFTALATSEVKEVLKGNAQTANLADKITSFSGAANVSDSLQAALQVHAIDARSAEEVRRLVEAAKGIVAFAAQGNEQYGPLIGDIIDVLKISSQKNTVVIGGSVNEQLINSGLKKGKKP